MTLQPSYLIQRLNAPFIKKTETSPLHSLGECFAFGGGLKNGGLSGEAMDLLRPIFSFDYMGSAEFEWGAVPECLGRIAKSADKYTAWVKVINAANVFIIGQIELKEQITERLWDIARYKQNHKENPCFKEALAEQKHYARYKGWIELNNHFLFFTDEAMFQKTCDLFDVPIPQ